MANYKEIETLFSDIQARAKRSEELQILIDNINESTTDGLVEIKPTRKGESFTVQSQELLNIVIGKKTKEDTDLDALIKKVTIK